MPVFIDPRICDKQMICDLMKVCPMSAIYQDEKEGTFEIDSTKCNECLLCVKACPYLAVKLAKDTGELGELRVNAGRVKFNRDAHLTEIYGAKPGGIGKAELNDSNFQEKVGSKTPTLVSFWGAHSGVIAPSLKWIEKRYRGKMKVAHIKIAENPESCKKYAITTTPTLILFREGKQIGRLEGVRHRETLRVWVEMRLKAR
jgi:thioredoxin 1